MACGQDFQSSHQPWPWLPPVRRKGPSKGAVEKGTKKLKAERYSGGPPTSQS